MILTCPDCSTRYSVDDSALLPSGRTVRCSKCGASWFISADPDVMALREQTTSSDIKLVGALTPAPSLASAQPDIAPKHTEVNTDPRTDNKSEAVNDALGAHVHMRNKADDKKHSRRLAGVFAIWAITLAMILIAGILAVLYRQPIVDKVPKMASVYKVLGVPVTHSGLNFEPPQSRTIIMDGQPTLIVNGFIVNRSNRSQPIPMIELSLKNGGGEVLARWAVEPKKDELAAQGRLAYESSYPNPPIDATTLEYKFLDENSQMPKVPEALIQ